MKKIMAFGCSLLLSFSMVQPIFGQKASVNAVMPTEMTITAVREQSRKYIYGQEHYDNKQAELKKMIEDYQDRYGKRYVMIDKEGNEVVKYFYNDDVSYDPVNTKKELSKLLDEMRDKNEKLAIESFLELLQQQNKVFLAKNQVEYQKVRVEGQKRAYELGKKTQVELQKELSALEEHKLQLKREELLLQQRYEDLNRLLGYPVSLRYRLNQEEIVQRVGEGKNSIAVPFYLTSKELSELKRLKDQKEELDRKKKAEEKLKNSWETEAEKEKIREKINLIEKEENYQEAEDKLTLQLKKTYLGNIQQFMDLSTKQQELEQEKKAYSNSELKKKLGKISKNEFLNSEKEYYTKEKGYLDAVLSMYQSIDGYEKLYDKK